MSPTIEQYCNEPILFISITDDVKPEALVHAYMDSIEAAGQVGQAAYRVFDFRLAETMYSSVYSTLAAMVIGLAGTGIRPTTQAVFLGQPHMAAFFAEQSVTFFDNVNDAINHVCSLTEAKELVA